MSECIFCGKPATHYVDYTEPMGDGYDTVCGDHAGKLSESMMEEQPATGAGILNPYRDETSGLPSSHNHKLYRHGEAAAWDQGYAAGKSAALEAASAKICKRIHDFPEVYQTSDCLVDIQGMLKGGEDDG